MGLYAVFAHAIAERRREMAIRIAVGAPGVLMLLVAGVATFLPARTASRADPTVLLKAE